MKFVQGALSPPGEPSEKIVTVRTTARTQAERDSGPGGPGGPRAPAAGPGPAPGRRRSEPCWARGPGPSSCPARSATALRRVKQVPGVAFQVRSR